MTAISTNLGLDWNQLYGTSAAESLKKLAQDQNQDGMSITTETGDTVTISADAMQMLVQTASEKFSEYKVESLDDLNHDEMKDFTATMGEAVNQVVSEAVRNDSSQDGSTASDKSGVSALAGAAGGGRGESSTSPIEQQIEKLEAQIKELQEEIQELSAKAISDEEAKTELNMKMSELMQKQAELSELKKQSS